jgi:hypothetical protein
MARGLVAKPSIKPSAVLMPGVRDTPRVNRNGRTAPSEGASTAKPTVVREALFIAGRPALDNLIQKIASHICDICWQSARERRARLQSA